MSERPTLEEVLAEREARVRAFEEHALAALGEGEAYSATVVDSMRDDPDAREHTLPNRRHAIQIALDALKSLERRGLAESWVEHPGEGEPGNMRRWFRLTAAGRAELARRVVSA